MEFRSNTRNNLFKAFGLFFRMLTRGPVAQRGSVDQLSVFMRQDALSQDVLQELIEYPHAYLLTRPARLPGTYKLHRLDNIESNHCTLFK